MDKDLVSTNADSSPQQATGISRRNFDKVLSCYFASKPDPQRQEYQEKAQFELMEDWYRSLHRVGLSGVIFHDHLSREFIEQYKTDQLEFRRVEIGERSLNDDRFYHYKKFLNEHPKIGNIFLTDLFDVEFKKNPFKLFSEEFSLYSGDELKSISRNKWMIRKLDIIRRYLSQFPENFALKKTLNAGIIGGSREVVLDLIINMLELFESLPKEFNANMPVYNMVAYSKFNSKEILHGSPLNSAYKRYQEEDDFSIRHK